MEWYYHTESGKQGPVAVEAIRKLMDERVIDGKTLIWKSGMTDWVPLASCSELTALTPTDVPPPIPERAIPNGFIWALTLAPIWGTFVQVLFTELWNGITGSSVQLESTWWIGIICNVTVSLLDLNKIKRFGHATEKIDTWMAFIVPVYIFQRDKQLHAGMIRFWIWIGSFFFSIAMSMVLFD